MISRTEESVLSRRIAGRDMGRELFSLIDGNSADETYMRGLIHELKQLAGLLEEAVPANEPKPEPIGRLGATVMPFGAHANKTFDETPLEYLDWLCRSQEDFYKGLRAYLKHEQLESYRRGIDG